MGTKNNPGAFDCYAAAAPDEPMFVLLARDKHAPALVWLWSTLRELDSEDPAKVAEARQCAADMMTWAHAHGRKVVGVGQAALAGTLELIRTANYAATLQGVPQKNEPTTVEIMRTFLAACTFEAPAPAYADDVTRCIACDKPMVAGDKYFPDASGGFIHAACLGPERECYTRDDEPLKDDDPIPEPYTWEDEPARKTESTS